MRAYRITFRDQHGIVFRCLLIPVTQTGLTEDLRHLRGRLHAAATVEDVTDSREPVIREAKGRAKQWRNMTGKMTLLPAA